MQGIEKFFNLPPHLSPLPHKKSSDFFGGEEVSINVFENCVYSDEAY